MNVLVACEYSGRVRDAFLDRGHYALSVDLLPTESPLGDFMPHPLNSRTQLLTHYQGNIVDLVAQQGEEWVRQFDLLIAHPPCTYLTIAAEWLYRDVQTKKLKPETLYGAARRAARLEAIEFIDWLWALPIKRVAIENPVGVIPTLRPELPKAQFVQPYWFGDDASKATGFITRGLPPLVATNPIPGRIVEYKGKHVERWANQTDSGQNKLPPSADRWKLRSTTYPGIADALAAQWGRFL